MPEPTSQNTLMFSTAKELADWLRSHHDSKAELWVKIFKKHSGVMSVTWDDVVVESLCWGWIDGIKKSLDDQAYLQRITPRKARSVWSKRNRDHVERLMAEGRMEEVGLAHVRAAQADGRWEAAYSVSEMEVPEDFIKALDDNPEAKAFLQH